MMDLKSPILLGPVQNQEHHMNGIIARRDNFNEHILGFLKQCYDEWGDLTGRHYDFITEYKTEDADTVFVSLGCAAENVEEACDYLRDQRNAKVGSIHVNVIRPFPEDAVINALRGKKNVIILERTDEGMAGDNPLGRDIRTALNKANQTHANGTGPVPALAPDETPRLFAGTYGLGSATSAPSTPSAPTSSSPARPPAKTAKHQPTAPPTSPSASTTPTRSSPRTNHPSSHRAPSPSASTPSAAGE